MTKLKCPHCGKELHLLLAYDGCDWDSEAGEGSGYKWSLELSCEQCGHLFPIGRLKNIADFSEPKEAYRAYEGRMNE